MSISLGSLIAALFSLAGVIIMIISQRHFKKKDEEKTQQAKQREIAMAESEKAKHDAIVSLQEKLGKTEKEIHEIKTNYLSRFEIMNKTLNDNLIPIQRDIATLLERSKHNNSAQVNNIIT